VRLLVVRKRATAEQLYAMIARGANFEALVRRYSIDTETRKRGGATTLFSGQGDARIAVAFALPRGGLSAPIRCRGWCVLQALSEVRAGRLLEFAEVEASVREAVREVKTTNAVAAWQAAVQASYIGRVFYAPGFEPSRR
jgi:parvulin-like peptidyl-prolyl isomerase